MEKDKNTVGVSAGASGMETVTRSAVVGRDSCEYAKEFTMPDYIPDIKRVISSGAKAAVTETGGTDGALGWECTVTFNALILCEGGAIRSVTLQGTQGGEVRVDPDASGVWLEADLENAGMRAADPRRLTGRCRIDVRACGRKDEDVGLRISGGDGKTAEGVEKLCETESSTSVSKTVKNDVRVSRDIELDPGDPEIVDIIRCEVTPYITSVRVNNGIAEAQGEANVGIIYSDAEGKYRMSVTRIPISAEAELPDRKAEVCFASATADEIKAVAAANTYGEQKIIELDFSWDLSVWSASSSEFRIVCDAYSVSDELDIETENVSYDKLAASFIDRFSVKGESTAEDLSLGSQSAVRLSFASASVDSVERGDDGTLIFKGTVYVHLICETGSENEPYASAEMKIPFTYARKAQPGSGALDHRACADVTGCRVRQDGATITAEADLCLGAIVRQTCERTAMTRAEVTGPISGDRPPLTLYYTEPDDDVWKIAKRFRVPAGSILRHNGVTENTLKDKKVVAIIRN